MRGDWASRSWNVLSFLAVVFCLYALLDLAKASIGNEAAWTLAGLVFVIAAVLLFRQLRK